MSHHSLLMTSLIFLTLWPLTYMDTSVPLWLLQCILFHPHLAEMCVSVYAEEGYCAEQVWLQEGVWPLWGSVEWSRAIWGGNLEGQDVCVFRGLDWEIGKAFGITLSLGSTHTPTYSVRAQMCLGGGGVENQDPVVLPVCMVVLARVCELSTTEYHSSLIRQFF